jgi:hypothetical protein
MARNRGWVAAGTVVAVNLAALSGLYSGSRYAETFSHNPTRPYVTALRGDIEALGGRPAMFDDTVPTNVVNPVLYPYNLYSNLLRGYPVQPNFVTTAESFVVPGPDGHLTAGTVTGAKSAAGPDGSCGWLVKDGTTVVRLESSVYEWTWLVKVGYLAQEDTTLVVDLSGNTVRVPVRKGLHEIHLRATGSGDNVRIATTEPGIGVCVGGVIVGGASPGARLVTK